MAFISFGKQNQLSWQARSWVFRQLINDVQGTSSGESEIDQELSIAEAFDGLSMYLLPKHVASRLAERIRTVVQATLDNPESSGIVAQPFGDRETIQQYLTSLRGLELTVHNIGTDWCNQSM